MTVISYHHRNHNRGSIRNGAPAYEDGHVGTSNEVVTRQMSDEEWEAAIARIHLKRSRYNGRTVYEEPTKSEGEETPHGTV